MSDVSSDNIIRKRASDQRVTPNLPDIEAARSGFAWEILRRELAGLPGGGLNIAHEAVDRHAAGPNRDKTALRWLPRENSPQDITYAELRQRSNRFANVLTQLGAAKGESLFVLAGRIPELYVGVLGGLKAGLVATPLFSAFGPEPIRTRIDMGRGKVLLTTASLYKRKVEPIRPQLGTLEHVLIVQDTASPADIPGTLDLARLMAEAGDDFTIVPTTGDDPSFLHFTSGTTGTPKGAIHVHGAAVMHYATGRFALDLHPENIFWCTADPGWVTGTSYGIAAPLLHGVTSLVDEADFDAERWYRILRDQGVTVWYTAPTAIRMLMKAGPELARQYRFPNLRFVASVGEPLNPEAVWWGLEVLGLPIHDNWWQTETGGIMIANIPSMDIKPGSMGKPLPGIDAYVVARDADGHPHIIDIPDTQGELALRVGWPSMFRGYLNQEERYRKCFTGDLYLTGNLVKRNAEGYFWFVGRADDVIKSAGHLIGPFEVESVLMEHPAVAEAGVTCRRHPAMNGFCRDGRFIPSPAVHVGVAISLRQGGLVAPAIHDADQKELGTLMADLNDLVGRARAGSLRSSEMSDATITVTNLGDQGVEAAYGVIYPPQVALVGFGAVNRRPWVEQDSLIAMPCTTVTLSADHRVSSGHQGALFLTEISRLLQHSDTL